ncbi:glycosyltransferase family 2 protein [Facilibium subflavum]|uniref:glycosyltransferase family 2 protein n=1 Tax=Facilibium subflavum TaxID=2219058 RepID=UPI000E650474|nr:glycosyltransferase family 2 protein [Facilibium subflavum]
MMNVMASKDTLGVVVITKNEEKNIARCLQSVKWANEIIVIDSGSTDKTVEIAESFGAKVIIRHWPGDGPQKYFGISQLTTKWCLVLDADEEVTKELAESIQKTIQSGKNTCYKLHRRSFFLGKIIKYGDWGRDWIVRLFIREKHEYTQDIAHSKVNVKKSQASALKGKLIHHTQEDIYLSIKKYNDYSTLSAQMMAKKGKRSSLLKAMLRGHLAFIRSYVLRLGFLDGARGYMIARNIAFGAYLKYLKLTYDIKP